MITAHFRGGPADGKLVAMNRAQWFSFPVWPYTADNTAQLGRFDYRPRRSSLHPPAFVARTGGPDAGHWIYDPAAAPDPVWYEATSRVAGEVMRAIGWQIVEWLADDLLRHAADTVTEGLAVDQRSVEITARTDDQYVVTVHFRVLAEPVLEALSTLRGWS